MPLKVKAKRRQVFVAERNTGLLHLEDTFLCAVGRPRLSVTACTRHLNFDDGEAAARIFAPLSLSNLRAEPCEDCIQAAGQERLEAVR